MGLGELHVVEPDSAAHLSTDVSTDLSTDFSTTHLLDSAVGVVRHLGTSDRSSQRIKVVDAALRCLARQGTTKTTVDDIAREAGLSRATLYRLFAGGREAIFAAVVDTEVARLFSVLAVAMGEATDLEDVLVAGMSEAARRLTSHAALNYLVEFEPAVILPVMAFEELDRLLAVASDFAAPFFGRWLDADQAIRAAEWAVRIVLSYLLNPADGFDLSHPDEARSLVQSFVLPGIQALMVIDANGGATPPLSTNTEDLNPHTH